MIRHWTATMMMAGLAAGLITAAAWTAEEDATGPAIRVHSFLPEKPISRAQRPTPVRAVIENASETPVEVTTELIVPDGITLVESPAISEAVVDDIGETERTWTISAAHEGRFELSLRVSAAGRTLPPASLAIDFLPAVEISHPPYIPAPVPVETPLLIGAHHCPLWEVDKPNMWSQLIKHPERTPALGFYAGENPEVSDWETKWAVEHGVSFFIYCWYRTSQGGPVTTQFSSAIHDALFKSKFVGNMKFTIMWENQSKGRAGVADEKDLMENLMPFWIENYFRHPSYVKIDNKPLLFIYRPEFLVDDLGGIDQVVQAFNRMRQACRDAGFDGLYLLGEYRGLEVQHLQLMKRLGLDYTFAYCWYVPDNPTPKKSIQTQIDYITKTRDLGILPQVVTVSQAWSGWHDEGTIWKIPPQDYKDLLRKAQEIIATFPAGELGRQILLLDNWNEWGEGHYIAPYREYGFGYLDAVREVFAPGAVPHADLIPEDIGRGPYDTPYQTFRDHEKQQRRQVARKVTKPGPPEDGLIGWWAFDEDDGEPVALDYAGHRLGGVLHDAERADGIDGKALKCDGGCVEVVNHPRLSPPNAMTLECWVKTDRAGQGNTWFVNRVLSGGTSTGYRMGILDGRPCFEIPWTDWSHHLQAGGPLPTGQWVHLAGTFDGQIERIYVNGEESGAMPRHGPIRPNEFPLCLGNYTLGHEAHFTGLLDEVKLYDRALTPDEIRKHYRQNRPQESK